MRDFTTIFSKLQNDLQSLSHTITVPRESPSLLRRQPPLGKGGPLNRDYYLLFLLVVGTIFTASRE